VNILSITPDHYASTADAQITITGAGFVNGVTVQLVAMDGTAYNAYQVEVDSFTRLTTTIAANTVPAGTYSVRVTDPSGNSAQIENAFTMKIAGKAVLAAIS